MDQLVSSAVLSDLRCIRFIEVWVEYEYEYALDLSVNLHGRVM